MGLVEDRTRLRREIEELRAARAAMKRRLRRFVIELRREMRERRSAIRKANSEQAARTHAAVSAFVLSGRRAVRGMLNERGQERAEAHRAWMGKLSEMRMTEAHG